MSTVLSSLATAPLTRTRTRTRTRTTILRDGSAVRLRALLAGEGAAILEFLGDVSADSLYLRFFGTCTLHRAAASLAACSRPGDVALVAEAGGDGSLVAHAAAFRVGPNRAEVAFLVADGWQGRGLGSILLSRLIDAARERGVATLVADVLRGNRAMLAVFQHCGYPVRIESGPQSVRVLIDTRARSDELLAA